MGSTHSPVTKEILNGMKPLVFRLMSAAQPRCSAPCVQGFFAAICAALKRELLGQSMEIKWYSRAKRLMFIHPFNSAIISLALIFLSVEKSSEAGEKTVNEPDHLDINTFSMPIRI